MCDIKVDYYKYCGLEDGTYFWMGTDYLGRDLWVRMWRGARVSLVIAFISVICNVFIGIVYGSIAGYYGGKIDMVMMRITEIIGAFPEIVVVTLFILFFGTGMLSIILCLVVQNLPAYSAEFHWANHYTCHDCNSGCYFYRVFPGIYRTWHPCTGKLDRCPFIPGTEDHAAVSEPGVFPGSCDFSADDRIQHAVKWSA